VSALLVAVVFGLGAAAACGGDGETAGAPDSDAPGVPDGPLTNRQLHRAIETLCADEVDARTADGPPDDFLDAAMAGDQDEATAAAAYNVDALDRFVERIRGLEAEDPSDADALAEGVRGIEDRRAVWADREERLSSGELTVDADDDSALLELVRDGNEGPQRWPDLLEHLDTTEPDCGAAVP
jgi:hypothetical protein